MSKITFNKLNLTKNTEVKTVKINDQIIEVKQYLPIQEKLELIADVLNDIQDNNNFINYIKMKAYLGLHIVIRYTNISFTEKQKEDAGKLYDLFAGNGIIDQVIEAIPSSEINLLYKGMRDIAEHMYEYRNSVYGVLDSLKTDYSNLELDTMKIAEAIQNPENLTLLKDVLNKMG